MFHSWLTWVLGLGSLGMLLVFAVLAPSVLPVVSAAVQPIAKVVGEGLAWFLEKLLSIVEDGLMNIFSNWQSIVTVLMLLMGMYWWVRPVYNMENCKPAIVQLHKHYRFVAKPGPFFDWSPPAWLKLL